MAADYTALVAPIKNELEIGGLEAGFLEAGVLETGVLVSWLMADWLVSWQADDDDFGVNYGEPRQNLVHF